MGRKILRIGVMSKEDYRQRTLAIARGEYTPKRDEPKIWFESLLSMAQVLNSENRKLLQLILEQHPQSLKELEQISGRSASNLSRTLKTMENYGIVVLKKKDRHLVPVVKASDFRVEFGVHASGF